jgi:hypothetical protein
MTSPVRDAAEKRRHELLALRLRRATSARETLQ